MKKKSAGSKWVFQGIFLALCLFLAGIFLSEQAYAQAARGAPPSPRTGSRVIAGPQSGVRPSGQAPGVATGPKCCGETSKNTQSTVDILNELVDRFAAYAASLEALLNVIEQGKLPREVYNLDVKYFMNLQMISMNLAKENRQFHDKGNFAASGKTTASAAKSKSKNLRLLHELLAGLYEGWGDEEDNGSGTAKMLGMDMCNNPKTDRFLYLHRKRLCPQGASNTDWGRILYWYARICASEGQCRALNICDLCDGGLGRAKRLTQKKQESEKGLTPVGFIQVQTGGGGAGGCGDDIPDGAGYNTGLIKTSGNINMKSGCDGIEAAAAAIKKYMVIDSFEKAEMIDYFSIGKQPVFPASYTRGGKYILVDGKKYDEKATITLKLMEQYSKLAEYAESLATGMAQSVSTNGQCDEDQYVEKMLQNSGDQPNKAPCLSCRQMWRALGALEMKKGKSEQKETGNSPQAKRLGEIAASARSAVAAACRDGGGSGTGSGSGQGWDHRAELLHDPLFFALVHNRDFNRMIVDMRDYMPKIYAQENIYVAQMMERELGPGAGQMLLAESQRILGMPDIRPADLHEKEIVPSKPFEKSASLSTIFASSGVNISGWTSMPVVPASLTVPAMAPIEPAMKPILISAPGTAQ